MQKGMTDTLQSLQDSGVQSGLGEAGIYQDMGDLFGGANSNSMSNALQRMQLENQQSANTWGGIGSMAGGYLGSRGK